MTNRLCCGAFDPITQSEDEVCWLTNIQVFIFSVQVGADKVHVKWLKAPEQLQTIKASKLKQGTTQETKQSKGDMFII